MGKLDGKVALITGASQGIGKGMARLFAAEGCRIAICARTDATLERTARELEAEGADVLARATDVADEPAVEALFDSVLDRFGRLDVLVNNAGAFDSGPIDELSLEQWNRVIGACLTGAFLCSRAAFRIMKKQGGGRILNIGSISAQRSRPANTPYTSAKFGVWGLTQATAIDGRPHGIICSCLHPGNVLVERRGGSERATDDEPMMSIETIAEAALSMVALPDHVNFLEAIVLPNDQLYLGRG